MPPKECDPKCGGRCNKNKLPVVVTAEKGCDPKCTGRCSKKTIGTSPPGKREIKRKEKEVCHSKSVEQYKLKDEQLTPERHDTIHEETPLVAEISPPDQNEIENEAVEQGQNIPAEEQKSIDDERQETPHRQSVSKIVEGGKLNCIIMDLDGVILDIETVYEYVIKDLVKKYGIADSETQRIIDLQDKETSTKFCSDYKLNISPQEFMIEFRKSALKKLADTPLMPGVENLMDYLTKNNFSVAVASNSNEEAYQLKTQNHRKFFQKFSHIVLAGSDPEVKSRKPSPKVYEVCCSRFPSKPDPKDIFVLEDAPEGVSAAIAAGMNVIWLPNKYTNKEDAKGVVAILNSINEFNPQEFGLV